MRGELQVFRVCFKVLGFNESPSPPVARLCTAYSLQPNWSHFTSLHFNQSIHLCTKSPVNLCSPFFSFLTHRSMWFSVLTKDGIRMMDMYLPVVWTVVLFFTTNWHHHHHHHHNHVLLITCSLSLMSYREINFSRQFLCGIISSVQVFWCPHTGASC